MQVKGQGGQHGTQKLGCNVAWDQAPGKISKSRHGDGHGRIEMGTAQETRSIDCNHDSHAPAQDNGNPAAILGLCFVQNTGGNHPISQENQEKGSD